MRPSCQWLSCRCGLSRDLSRRPPAISPWQILWTCLVFEHALVILKFYVQVRISDEPLWVLKAAAYQEWLDEKGKEYVAPSKEEEVKNAPYAALDKMDVL